MGQLSILVPYGKPPTLQSCAVWGLGLDLVTHPFWDSSEVTPPPRVRAVTQVPFLTQAIRDLLLKSLAFQDRSQP